MTARRPTSRRPARRRPEGRRGRSASTRVLSRAGLDALIAATGTRSLEEAQATSLRYARLADRLEGGPDAEAARVAVLLHDAHRALYFSWLDRDLSPPSRRP